MKILYITIMNQFEVPKSEKERAAELKEVFIEARERIGLIEASEVIVPFVNEIRAHNPDYQDYVLYHIVADSTPQEGHELKFDLPGGEIEKFIRSL